MSGYEFELYVRMFLLVLYLFVEVISFVNQDADLNSNMFCKS